MAKYKVLFDGELQDEIFDTEEEAEEYGSVLCSDYRTGCETLHWSNPGDYEYDDDSDEGPDFEIIEV